MTELVSQYVRLPDHRSLRAVVAGEGEPIVVFESGSGVCAGMWMPVQRRVAAAARTVAYDRAGYGGSDDDPRPGTMARIVDDLAAMLDAITPHAAPVLVGSSLGGTVIRTFAAAHPGRVRGLVLVDPSTATALSMARAGRALVSVVGAAARFGLHRPIVRPFVASALQSTLTPAERRHLDDHVYTARNWRAAARELRDDRGWFAATARLEAAGLPDVPVTTVVGLRTGPGERAIRPRIVEFGRREMAAHPQGRFVTAEHSHHLVAWQQPDLVAEEILRLSGLAPHQRPG